VEGESHAYLVYEYPQTTAFVDVAWQPAGIGRGGVVLVGDRGSTYYEGTMGRGPSSRFRLVQDGKVLADETRSPLEDFCESFYAFEPECVDCMVTGKPVTQSGPVNLRLRALACTFAAYAVARQGRALPITE